MEGLANNLLLRTFSVIKDPRARNISHLLSDMVTIAILAVFCGEKGWEDIHDWAEDHEEFLRTFLPLPNGIPSHDTMGRVFRLLDPDAFEAAFIGWTTHLQEQSKDKAASEKFIAFDGKSIRGSFESGWKKSPVHLVSAYASDHHLVLGQLRVKDKENEIVAIPKLIELLDLRGTTVTIDAMGCQKEIAGKIREKKSHYLLALKDNHPMLHEAVKKTFAEGKLEAFKDWRHDVFVGEVEAGHGRIEQRTLYMTSEIKHIEGVKDWPGLASIVMIESHREDLSTGKVSDEPRYYLCSWKKPDAAKASRAIRAHWQIENGQHHVLDVSMDEDGCRIRKGNGAENFARLRRITLNRLSGMEVKSRNGKVKKMSLRRKQRKCARDAKFLISALLE